MHVSFSARSAARLAFALACAGCATRARQGEAMPVVEVKPGYVERIALMDRYRRTDDLRKHMMRRPRVWVEELPAEEPREEEAPSPEEQDATDAAPE